MRSSFSRWKIMLFLLQHSFRLGQFIDWGCLDGKNFYHFRSQKIPKKLQFHIVSRGEWFKNFLKAQKEFGFNEKSSLKAKICWDTSEYLEKTFEFFLNRSKKVKKRICFELFICGYDEIRRNRFCVYHMVSNFLVPNKERRKLLAFLLCTKLKKKKNFSQPK